MRYINNPGPWLQYRDKPENQKLSLHEATEKFKHEQLFYDLQNQPAHMAANGGKTRSYQFTSRNYLRVAAEEWMAFPWATERFYGHISTWDVSRVTDFRAIFKGLTAFNDDIGSWDVSNGTSFQGMFSAEGLANNMTFNQDIGSWNIEKATTIAGMFDGAVDFDQDISAWNPFALSGFGGLLFMNGSGVGLSTSNYNALLIAWQGKEAQLTPGVEINFGASAATGDGSIAKDALEASPASWTIVDAT